MNNVESHECKWCNESFEINRLKFAAHVKWCIKNPKRIEHLEKLRMSRESASSEDSRKRANEKIKEAHKNGRYKGAHENLKGKSGTKHTDETKKKLSEMRKSWLQENPDSHPWRKKSKFLSEPCEFLKNKLIENGVEFVEEYIPLKNRFFSMDIAFLDLKKAIEVNGEQHYNRDRTLKKYYQDRHDLIESDGWKILELHYAECYNDSIIEKIKNFLSN
jgi:very-short-patch-repair endonuclease